MNLVLGCYHLPHFFLVIRQFLQLLFQTLEVDLSQVFLVSRKSASYILYLLLFR